MRDQIQAACFPLRPSNGRDAERGLCGTFFLVGGIQNYCLNWLTEPYIAVILKVVIITNLPIRMKAIHAKDS